MTLRMSARIPTRRLQQLFVLSSAFGIFSVGLIVAIAGIVPIYDHLKREEERNLLLAMATKTMAVEEYLSKARDVTLQITSRTQARAKLEEYNSGKITRKEAADFTKELLADAMNYSREIQSISRLDSKGELLAGVGVELPEAFRPVLEPDQKEPTYHGPVMLGDRSYLMVAAPILNRKKERVGEDIVLFQMFQLQRIIEDRTGLGTYGETIIGVMKDDHVELLFPFRETKTTVPESVSKDSPIGKAMQNIAQKRTGILIPGVSTTGDDLIAYGPIHGSTWGIMVTMDRHELYAPVMRHIWSTAKLIGLLIFFGTITMVLLVRPLSGKLIIQTGELEKEVQEKTAILQKELVERRRIEQWLIDSERRYRTLVEEVPDVIFILDSDGHFLYANTQVERFLERSVVQILDSHLKDYVVPDDRVKVDAIFKQNVDGVWDEEVGVIDGKGNRKYSRIRCKIVSVDEDGSIRYEGVMRDITVRRSLERELKASREELLEKIGIIDELYEHIVQSERSKAIADHTAEVAHELRQPLAIIGGFARRMLRNLESGKSNCDVDQRNACKMMIAEVVRLERILDSLIDFTRRENVHPENVDPNDLIEKVLTIYEPRMKEKNLRVDTILGRELGEMFLDPNRFEQVIRNLISNAIEASENGETILVQTGFSIPSDKAQETGSLESEVYFEMKVKNFGRVIPPEEIDKIFSPFFTTKNYGTGIGLTICKKIVENHGGSISVRSDNEGTLFTVWLPLDHKSSKSYNNVH